MLTAFKMTICISDVAAEDNVIKEIFRLLIILMSKK